MAQDLRQYILGYMYALSWKLLIIDLLSEYFAILLKRLHLKKIAAKCSIFLHWLYFFSYWKVKDVFWLRIKFHLGEAEGRGKRWVWREKPKMRVNFAKIPIIRQDKNFILQTADSTTLSYRRVGHSWSSSLLNLHFVNICPQWCRWHWWLQQGDWYSAVEGFQLC